ncbi:MAG: acyltransferase [Ruminococcus sp.]|nr:acyltransferase [Ruminococcus sp.]
MIRQLLKEIVYRLRGEYTTEKLLKMGLKVGSNFHRLIGVIIDPAHCWLIEIGDNVTLAPRVHILAHDASTKQLLGYAKIGKVTIGNNVFIGADSVVLPNVHIGDNVIVGANSTVTRDLESGFVYAGSPAKKITSIEEFINKNKALIDTVPCFGEEYTTRQNVSDEKKKEMREKLSSTCGFIA